ncbi:MAG: MucB/RseB C-terminal domain-containing protein [Acidiferrobacteraceae bacterium]
MVLSRRSLFLAALSLTFAASAEAALSAPGWLMRMDKAAKQVSYRGTFIYQHGNMLETMRILHRAGKRGVRELLESLNGVRREVVRGHRQIRCYFPNQGLLVVERARPGGHAVFPSLPPKYLTRLGAHYIFRLGAQSRVAGRKTQIVLIQPRDGYRYGYRLWADDRTGLLLRSDIVNEGGHVVEQVIFTDIRPGVHIPRRDLNPPAQAGGFHTQQEAAETPVEGSAGWTVTQLPPGFQRVAYLARTAGGERVRHLVYSDGLAAVSVFIRHLSKRDSPAMTGLRRMGAVYVYDKVVSGHQVTVMGEVPKATIAMIGKSVVQDAR